MKSAFQELQGPFPFAAGQGQPLVSNKPFLGGWLVGLAGSIGANANYQIPHGLRAKPRFAIVLDVGAATGFNSPLPRGSTAWDNKNIYVNLPAVPVGSTVWLLIA